MFCVAAPPRHDHHQGVDVARHVDQPRIVAVGDAGLGVSAVVDDGHPEGLQPARDRLADPPHANDPDGAVAQRRLGERIALRGPFAGPQIALGLRKLPHGAQQESERGVGHFLVEDVGRVGGHDAMLGRPFDVDMIVADAEARHDLQAGKARHQGAVDRDIAERHRKAAHLAGELRQESVAVLCVRQLVQVECRREPVGDHRLRRAEQQYVGLLARHSRISLAVTGALPRCRHLIGRPGFGFQSAGAGFAAEAPGFPCRARARPRPEEARSAVSKDGPRARAVQAATDLGFTRDRHYSMRKSATADLRVRDASLRDAPHHEVFETRT
jgi:hypothetical protein